ncbi:LysR substrate-binding domain-containing protein [Anderseniella sp. Alg231-50]|uniref:LysR substrate-binding domain-containing protein n=1 Tax=Anderseniella sp. Alg231-50 TaxID=1922226 RepID=UPI00307BDFD6
MDIRGQFLQAMSCAANTVNVVTTDGAAGRAGVTVSAMASVSADGDAPTMLVCVHHLSAAAQTILDNGCFCTNILRDDQSFISDTFAGRLKTEDGDKFSCVDWVAMKTGAPRVRDPLTAFDCTVKSSERVGTHFVFIGEVQDIFVATGGSPLIFANRMYGSPVTISPPRKQRAETDTLRIGTLHTFGPYLLPSIIRKLEDEVGPIDLDLHEGDQRELLELLRAGTIDLAFVYDFDLGSDVTALTVSELPTYVLLAENDPLAAQGAVALADLVARPMVLLDASPSRDYFLSLFAGIGDPHVAYRTGTFEMVRGMVAHGLGYSLLATKPASAMSYDGKALVTRPLVDRVETSRLVLSQRRDVELTKSAEAFVWHCVQIFGLDMD